MSELQIGKRTPVQSSNIAAVTYDADGTLTIEFKNSGVYHYANVPESAARQLVAAPSVGKHFHMHVRDKYACQKRGEK